MSNESGWCVYVEFDSQDVPEETHVDLVDALEKYSAVTGVGKNGNFGITLTIERDTVVDALTQAVVLTTQAMDAEGQLAEVVGAEVTTYAEQSRRDADG